MQYAILFYETAADFAQRNDPKKGPEYWGAWGAYIETLTKSGIVRGGAGLQPPTTGTTVRLRAGQRQVQDGPFADTKEQLGGFFLVDLETETDALALAAEIPGARGGTIEVRAVTQY